MISGSSGGYLLNYPLNVVPGETIAITIGQGGLPGDPSQDGGSTVFGSYLLCSGGGHVQATTMYPPGDCSGKGFGNYGQQVVASGSFMTGGMTPFGYGSGGTSSLCVACSVSTATSGQSGIVIVDVLY